MKKLLYLFVVVFAQMLSAQSVENFDGSWTNWADEWMNGGNSLVRTYDSTFKMEGAASLRMDWVMKAEDWGGGISFARFSDPGSWVDMSIYDTISFWYYVEKPSTKDYAYLALILRENPVSSAYDADPSNVELWRHQITNIFGDKNPGWHQVSIPLKTIGDPLNPTPADWLAGFNMQGRNHQNNTLDWDYVRGFYLEIDTDTALYADSGSIYIDNLVLSGSRATPLVLFNGKTAPNGVKFAPGWTGSTEVSKEADYDNANTGSIKWTCGSDADGGGWDGVWFDLAMPHKLGELWQTDSLQFAIKAPAGFGNLWIAFADPDDDGNGPDRMYQSTYYLDESKIGAYDGNWRLFKIALKDFVAGNSWDGDHLPGSVDSTRIIQFRIEGDGQSVQGKVVYFDNIWTGNYTLDIIPPAQPQVQAFSNGDYLNTITWTDVPGEKQEAYKIYTSLNAITDVNADGVQMLHRAIQEGFQMAEHELKYPLVDKDVANYYAIVCVDNAGNESLPAVVGPVTNLAKGIPVISSVVPANFKADGDISEWTGIKPIRMFPSDGTGHIASNYIVDNDADLSTNTYLAADAQNLYVAFDVTDDIVSYDATLGEWENDAPDLFIGLYNQIHSSHTSYARGAEPDYRLLFDKRRLLFARPWVDSILVPGENYTWKEKFPNGYIVEAKIPWTLFSSVAGDPLFVPQVGMKLPLEVSINDADATGSREGLLTWSKNDNDDAYADVSSWVYTWFGDKPTVGVEDKGLTATSFALGQNYPNPFNPSTVITYSIQKPVMVSLKVYDVLGRVVATLVNQNQNSGVYNVSFNAAAFSTGVYFYKLEAGNFVSIKKMLLLK